MTDLTHLDWPFFDDRHRALAREAAAWAQAHLGEDAADVDAACRRLVALLGRDGWLRHAVGGREFGGAADGIDTRAICLLREVFAQRSALADFAFAMQGLGSGAIGLYGTPAQKARWLPAVAAGQAITAFALSEPEAGSDVAAIATAATADAEGWVLDGEKTWISNGGIADFYVVFARTGEAPGSRGLSAFVVAADAPGLEIAERIETMAPHPLARLRFSGCRVGRAALLGTPGQGFKVAMATLDVFRTSVAAAALGLGRRALAESLARVTTRRMFGQTLADFQLTQARLADMATGLDAAALLTYRAAWRRDRGEPVTRDAAMAKWTATETAWRAIDGAVQLHGGLGVTSGHPVERLYREIRALRIYEGASEVQQVIVGRETLKAFARGREGRDGE